MPRQGRGLLIAYFQFTGKLFDRSELKGAAGKFLRGRLKDDTSNA